MSITIGKNIDTGIMTLTFDSSGRKIDLTPEEGKDFAYKVGLFKAEERLRVQHEQQEEYRRYKQLQGE